MIVVYVDPTRTRFRLTEKQLAAAAVISRQPDEPRTAPEFGQLADAVLVTDDGLDPQLELLLDVLTVAPVEITIEVQGAGEAIHLAWADHDAAVVAVDVGAGVHEYQLVDPVLLPWTLALAAGVGARPHEPRQRITLPQDVVEAAHDQVTGGDDPTGTLAEHLPAEATAEVVELLRQRRATWRATSRRPGDEGEPDVATTTTVLDGGVAGYYTLDATGGQVTLTPAAPSEIFERLHHLVPGLLTDGTEKPQEHDDATLDDP